MNSFPLDELVLATNNKHKVTEIRAILRKARIKIKVMTLDAFPKRRPTVEDKNTLRGNAGKKAREVAKHTNRLALADDTGLFVKALRGKPGVYSARFAGPGCTFDDNNRKILRLMKKVAPSRRQASFRCVAALATPKGAVVSVEGRIEGAIAVEPRGMHGFGYDPIFMVPKYRKTFAELGASVKNKISHRAKAFSAVPSLLRKIKK